MVFYDKLVRDNIPDIIRNSGEKCEVEIVNNDLALNYLYKKLNEEVCELFFDKNIDEIIDVMEVLFAIGAKYGYSEKDLLNKRDDKKNSHGGFNENIILKKTYKLPNNLRGIDIHTKIIPTICSLKDTIDKLIYFKGDISKLKPWEKISYQSYQLDDIKIDILNSDKIKCIDIIKKHILLNHPSYFGASCIDIYLVAYVSEVFGPGKETFFKYIYDNNISQESTSAQAIWQVGKADGEFLGILNSDGSVNDWDFINMWIR